jgi:transcriptional regulator GlxA family with amidase domain
VSGLRASWLQECVDALQGRALQAASDPHTWKRAFSELLRDLPHPASIVEQRILKGLIAELVLQHASRSGLIQSEYVAAVLAAADTALGRRDGTRHPKVALALKMIEAEATRQRPRLKPIAAAVGLSSCHLSRLVKSEIKRSLPDYVREVRVGRAMALLEIPSKSVKEVAFELGYHYSGNLARDFRRERGQSPSQWRRSQRT